MMAWFHIESKIKAEIIGNPVTIAVCIINLHRFQTLIIILSGRNRSWTSCTVIHIERQTISTGKFIVSYQFEVMWLVIFRRIPFAIIHRTCNTRIILAQESTGICIACPSVQLAGWLLYLELNTISISFRINHICFQMMVHHQLC